MYDLTTHCAIQVYVAGNNLSPPCVNDILSFIFMNFHFFQSTFTHLNGAAALRMIFPLFASSQWHNPKKQRTKRLINGLDDFFEAVNS